MQMPQFSKALENYEPTTITPSTAGVLIIDAQPLFWNRAFGRSKRNREPIMARLENLLMLANWFGLPTIATFEHPTHVNGELPERLRKVFPNHGQCFTKRSYDCTGEAAIRQAIENLPVKQLAVAGAETDVCILQSVLGLMRMGRQVLLLEDCLFSTEANPGPALHRMHRAGAIPCTFKSLAYEMARGVHETPWLSTWSQKDQIGAKRFPAGFRRPEALPPWKGGRGER
jgi:nicotinamidase-related amidase